MDSERERGERERGKEREVGERERGERERGEKERREREGGEKERKYLTIDIFKEFVYIEFDLFKQNGINSRVEFVSHQIFHMSLYLWPKLVVITN